jgi:hypothetical protein
MKKWTQKEETLLEKLYCTTSHTIPEIAQMLGRDKGGVSAKVGKMCLIHKRKVIKA